MKKIGIITYHFAKNYGAVWQCFALQEFLRLQGYDSYVINAISNNQKNNNSFWKRGKGLRSLVANVVLLPFFCQRKRKDEKFSSFVDHRLNCSLRVKSVDELKSLVESEKYDAIISGSDQVFNPLIDDFDKMFLLPFNIRSKKIGYSVSIGNASYSELKELKDDIRDFNWIGIRELSSHRVLEELYEKRIDDTVDPVLLLSKSQWEKEIYRKESTEKYLLCYFIDKHPIKKNLRIAEKIATKKGLKVKCIWMHINKESFDNRFILDAGPSDFLDYIYNADTIVTDGYHGTVFATIFEKELYSIINNVNGLDSRITDYLKLFGLERRAIDDSIDEIDYTPINYGYIRDRIQFLREKSSVFLKEAIDG